MPRRWNVIASGSPGPGPGRLWDHTFGPAILPRGSPHSLDRRCVHARITALRPQPNSRAYLRGRRWRSFVALLAGEDVGNRGSHAGSCIRSTVLRILESSSPGHRRRSSRWARPIPGVFILQAVVFNLQAVDSAPVDAELANTAGGGGTACFRSSAPSSTRCGAGAGISGNRS